MVIDTKKLEIVVIMLLYTLLTQVKKVIVGKILQDEINKQIKTIKEEFEKLKEEA